MHVRRTPQWVLVVILAGLGMVGPFTIDTMFPAFAQMGTELQVSEVALQQLISVYLISFGAMSLFHGPISDAVGRRPVIIAGGLLYIVASVGSALAPSLGWLLAMRVVQGGAAGAGQILSRTMVSDLFPRPVAQRVMSHIAMIFGLAPALAPVVGGWLLLFGDWRWIYWFLAAFGLIITVLVLIALPESNPPESRTPLRIGPLLSGLAQVWQDPAGRRLAFTGMANFSGMFLYISAAPLFVVNLLGGGEQDFWWLFFPLIGGMVIGSYVSGRLVSRMPGERVATWGFRVALTASLVNLGLALLPGAVGMPWLVMALPVLSFGVALAFPVLTLEMIAHFPARRGAASSVQSFIQLMANAVIAGVVAPYVAATAWGLALTTLGFCVLGTLLWRRHVVQTGQE
ncbi:MAG: multidrug effflux MFS transporter [Propioniciclava sp.]